MPARSLAGFAEPLALMTFACSSSCRCRCSMVGQESVESIWQKYQLVGQEIYAQEGRVNHA
jgi:hypothetical protein